MAFLFDGVNDVVQNTTANGVAGIDTAASRLVTWVMFVKSTNAPTGHERCIYFADTNDLATLTMVGALGIQAPGTAGVRPKLAVSYSANAYNLIGNADVSSGAWHHLAVTANRRDVVDGGPDVLMYVDGVSVAFTVESNPGAGETLKTGWDNASLGAAFTAAFLDGDMAEVAFWLGTRLSTAQILSLSKGFSPIMMNPLPTRYWDFINGARERMGGLAMTVSGATVAAHSQPVYYPTGPKIGIHRDRRLTAGDAILVSNVL